MKIKKYGRLIFSIVAIFFTVSYGLTALAEENILKKSGAPLKNISVSLKKEQVQSFYDEVKSFAEKHNFNTTIDPKTGVELLRQDIMIFGNNNTAPEKFELAIYKSFQNKSDADVPSKMLNDLVTDFEVIISKIEGATLEVK